MFQNIIGNKITLNKINEWLKVFRDGKMLHLHLKMQFYQDLWNWKNYITHILLKNLIMMWLNLMHLN